MNVLGLDAAGPALAVGVLRAGRPAGQVLLARPEVHSRLLVRVVADLLRHVGLKPGQLQLLAVGAGPGSYTGLRLAAMAAKTLAWCAGALVVGVDSLAVRAAPRARACPGGPPVGVLLPARRERCFGRLYDAVWPPAPLGPLREGPAPQVMADLEADARAAGRPTPAWAGEGATTADGDATGDAALHLPQGLLVASLGLLAAQRGQAVPSLTFLPAYAGPSPVHDGARAVGDHGAPAHGSAPAHGGATPR